MRSSNYLRQAKRRQNRGDPNRHVGYSENDKVIGKDSLANLLNTTVTQVERWIREGLPVEQRGDLTHEWVFDLTEVKDWQQQHLPEE